MDHERLVAVGGYFDGKLMPPTAVGLDQLRMPIHERLAVGSGIADPVPATSEMRVEDYNRGEFSTQEKVFAVWISKGLTYADVMQRLLDRYAYEK